MKNSYHICEFVIVKFFSIAPWNLQMNLTVNPLTDTLHNRNYQAWEDIYLALESTSVICVESQYGNINGSKNECQFIACNCLDRVTAALRELYWILMEPCSRTLGMEIPVSLSEFELLISYKQSSYLTVLLVVIGICIPKIEHGSINSNKLLFRFCPNRWTEDQSVAERAVKIWLNLVKIIKYWESLCKSKRPRNSSYETLVLHYKNPLMIAKFHFVLMLQEFSKVI